jgi:hypothetical protein
MSVTATAVSPADPTDPASGTDTPPADPGASGITTAPVATTVDTPPVAQQPVAKPDVLMTVDVAVKGGAIMHYEAETITVSFDDDGSVSVVIDDETDITFMPGTTWWVSRGTKMVQG